MIQKRIKAPENEDDCWLWAGSVMTSGYGQIELRENGERRHHLAHRLVAELLGFPLGENMHHRETCPKRCVNPGHLTPLTIAEHAAHHGHEKEFCVHGHPLADAYLVKRKDGTVNRFCKYCMAERGKARRARMTKEESQAENRLKTIKRRERRARLRAERDEGQSA